MFCFFSLQTHIIVPSSLFVPTQALRESLTPSLNLYNKHNDVSAVLKQAERLKNAEAAAFFCAWILLPKTKS